MIENLKTFMGKKILMLMFILVTSIQAQNIIENIQFKGFSKFSEEQFLIWSGFRQGSMMSDQFVEKTSKNIINKMHEQGYLYARVDSVSILNDTTKNSTKLIWHIKEDLPFQIGKIKIVSDSISVEDINSKMDIKQNDLFAKILIEQDFQYINRLFADSGFPFADLQIKDLNIRKEENYYAVDFTIKAKAGKTTQISQILIKGNDITKDDVILREIYFEPGSKYNQDEIDKIPQTLNRLGYFKYVIPPKLVFARDKELALLIELEEGNTTTFDGIIGYIPDNPTNKDAGGYFTGLIDASLRNIFGTGRKFEIFWKKPDKFSDQFKLYYEEPWIFGLPVNIGFGLERLVRDTTYIERTYFLNGSFRLSNNLTAKFAVSQKSTIPDSLASRTLRLSRNFTNSIEVGIEYDTRDYPFNPRGGILYTTQYTYGQKKNTGPSYLLIEDEIEKNEEIQKIQVSLEYYLPLWFNQLLSFNIYGAQIKSSKDQLQLTDHIWFGGARSLRGYRENQFHGSVISWLNLEYRFLVGRNSRLFLFNDWGFYHYSEAGKKIEDIMPGFGLGIRFDTALGIMGVDYGLGKGDSFSNGKIHFGIENRF